MRFPKGLAVSATILVIGTSTVGAFADDTTTATGATGSTTTSSSTVLTPSSPAVPVTSTTTTAQGVPPSTVVAPGPTVPATTPTSTTTTTSADPTAAPMAPVERDKVTLYKHQRPNKALLITGGSLLVSTYVTTAAVAAGEGSRADRDLYIPVAGPWINLANRESTSTGDTVLIAGSGVLQGVGAAMTLASFLIPEKVATAQINAGPVKMHVVPTASAGAGGLGAVGTF